MKVLELRSGAQSNFEMAIRFADWCDARSSRPTWREVVRAFRVNRATAYRWLSAWKAARGVA